MRRLLWLLPFLLLASEPPQLDRPAAGASVIDPVFGGKIIRISSASEGAVCTHNYSIWSPFNSDNTRLIMMCWADIDWNSPTQWLVNLNSDGTPGTKTNITSLNLNVGIGVQWHPTDPDILYYIGNSNDAIRAYDFGLPSSSLIKDLSGYTPHISRLTVDDAGDIFCVNQQDSGYGDAGVLVWKKSIDTVLVDLPVATVGSKPQIDNNGAYAVAFGNSSNHNCIIDVSDESYDCKANDNTYRSGGHGDLGQNNYCHWEGWESTIICHVLSTGWTPWDEKFDFGYYGFEFHGSLTSELATLLVVGTSRSCPVGESFPDYSNELFTVNVSTEAVVRWAHTRANPCDGSDEIYWQTVRPAWSPDQRFVAFTSNWYPETGWATTADLYLLDTDPPESGRPTFVGTLKGRAFLE